MRARKREHYEDLQIRITDHKTKQKKRGGKRMSGIVRARVARTIPLWGINFFYQ